jgi:hypothetical protein
VLGLSGAAVVVVTVDALGGGVAPADVPPPLALPVEHAATREPRTRATGRTARDRIRLGIARP